MNRLVGITLLVASGCATESTAPVVAAPTRSPSHVETPPVQRQSPTETSADAKPEESAKSLSAKELAEWAAPSANFPENPASKKESSIGPTAVPSNEADKCHLCDLPPIETLGSLLLDRSTAPLAQASIQSPAPPETHVTQGLARVISLAQFSKHQFYGCSEIYFAIETSKPNSEAALAQAVNELLRAVKTRDVIPRTGRCHEISGNRLVFGQCVILGPWSKNKEVLTEAHVAYYDQSMVFDDDSLLQDCLAKHGTWRSWPQGIREGGNNEPLR